MADHELHHITKAKISAAIIEAKKAGKAKGSWHRIVTKSGVSAATWHKATSPVLERENGRLKINTTSLKKMAKALGLDEDFLVNIALGKKASE